jgi:molybdopterin synthase catalytic subunit
MISLVEGEIRPSEVLEKIRDPSRGAMVLFLGTVRSPSNGREVTHLIYEAYREMALEKLKQIVDTAKSRWEPGDVAVVHRLGKVEVGEISLLIAVSSPHRATAYEVSRFVIEEIKKEVPIWKKEYGRDGERWVESGA